jgi:hypothetical protein
MFDSGQFIVHYRTNNLSLKPAITPQQPDLQHFIFNGTLLDYALAQHFQNPDYGPHY